MFDARLRTAYLPAFAQVGARLARIGVRPLALTALGWFIGVLGCLAVAFEHWHLGLVLWLLNRLLDGLDGAVARVSGPSKVGGLLDLIADFSIYAGFVLAVAIALPQARLVAVVLLCAYYLSGATLLALAPALREAGRDSSGRTLVLAGGLAEGAETIVVYVLICLFPGAAVTLMAIFAGAVLITALQRIVTGTRLLNAAIPRPTETLSAPKED